MLPGWWGHRRQSGGLFPGGGSNGVDEMGGGEASFTGLTPPPSLLPAGGNNRMGAGGEATGPGLAHSCSLDITVAVAQRGTGSGCCRGGKATGSGPLFPLSIIAPCRAEVGHHGGGGRSGSDVGGKEHGSGGGSGSRGGVSLGPALTWGWGSEPKEREKPVHRSGEGGSSRPGLTWRRLGEGRSEPTPSLGLGPLLPHTQDCLRCSGVHFEFYSTDIAGLF